MSLRTTYPPIPRDRFFTPPHAVHALLAAHEEVGLFPLGTKIWECAAGAGHIARIFQRHGWGVLATDVAPAKKPVVPVAMLDFLKTAGPSGGARLSIITNPPYGKQSARRSAMMVSA